MEHPSQKWLNKFSETLVPETFIKIFYDSTEPGVQKDASASADAQASFSNVSGITSDDNEHMVSKYSTGEPNLHLLDGTFLLLPAPGSSADDAGYISRDIVSESNHPKLTFTFSRLHTRPIPVLRFCGLRC